MLIRALSNGCGSQSIYLFWLMCQGLLPERISIAADTGSEKQKLWSTGEQTSTEEYHERIIRPLGEQYGIECYFVRAVDKDKQPLPSIEDWIVREVERARRGERGAKYGSQPMPLFGSKGGRWMQSCTDKWKIGAIKQQLRRLGATEAISAQGIHYGEAARRVKGIYLYDTQHAGYTYSMYQSTKPETLYDENGEKKRDPQTGKVVKVHAPIKWMKHYYPLVDLKLGRMEARRGLEEAGIPYLVTTECDICPHQDLTRWERLPQERIEYVAEIEKLFDNQHFFTSRRIPLLDALREMKAEREVKILAGMYVENDPDFGCNNSICGV